MRFISLIFYFISCLYASTGENKPIQAFVIPHSHMDVGWVYTIQESMHAYAANVYTSVTEELSKVKHRKFIAVEQEFFRLWWDNVASDSHKKQVRQLVKEGRLEFILGGQVMHDEAVTDLDDEILQMTEGHGFLYDTFGVRPQFSWHVDPFGASATTPVLFALAGFNAHIISRIDYDLKDRMQQNKKLQFMWRGSSSLKEQIFTHTMDQFSYCTPSHLPFSNSSGFYWNGVALFPDPPKDGVYPNMSLPVTKATVQAYAKTMVENIKQRAAWFKTKHVLWPWGCDKQFYNSSVQFSNMDPLMNYINQKSEEFGVTVQYATLSEYFLAVHQSDLVWEVRGSQDFLPYSTASQQAWTGFYASRNVLKGVARRASSQLHAAETLFTRYRLNYPDGPVAKDWALSKLRALRWAVSEVQHHDGITGTESPRVAEMYLRHLTQAMMGVDELLAAIFLLPHNLDVDGNNYRRTKGAHQTLEQHIIVYNPLAWNITTLVNITVTFPFARVFDDARQAVPAQIQKSALSNRTYDLFILVELGGLQHRKYLIKFSDKPCSKRSKCGATFEAKGVPFERRSVRNRKKTARRLLPVLSETYKLMFDQDTNLLHSITYLQDKKRIRITQDFWEYHANGDVQTGPISDNYMFSANGSAVRAYEAVQMEIIPGIVMSEIRQYFYRNERDDDYAFSVVTRVPRCFGGKVGCHRLEQTYSLGPLPINTEVVFRTSSSLKSERSLYTDDNGYQMMKRTHTEFTNNTLARNYFPMVRTAYIEDEVSRLVLLSERAHGVSSQTSGQLEVMLHRRLWNNLPWNLGYNLTLNDSSVVRPTLWMMLGSKGVTSKLYQRAAVELQHTPVVMVIDQPREEEEKGFLEKEPRGSSPSRVLVLPPNLHLLSLSIPGWNYSSHHDVHLGHVHSDKRRQPEPDYDRVLLRIMHIFEEGEDPELSKPVTIHLQDVLQAVGEVSAVEERSLTGTWDVASMQRWTWKTTEDVSSRNVRSSRIEKEPFSVTISPKQIRTFFVYFKSGPRLP
uniref:epididymis-specific alpha-mannosidase isoform X1 n=2 Tax=Doryrhamphus excisus TaxID=161450 RepID=UPI0025ADF4A5|nr:epididymis-specific alpha-mannosidase isoform X1 [Doryrhamphus excisus]